MSTAYESDKIFCAFISPESMQDAVWNDDRYNIYITADGLSSDPESKRGSETAVNAARATLNVLHYKSDNPRPNPQEWVEAAINAANKAVYDINLVKDRQGKWQVGQRARTTIDVAYIRDDMLYAAHAGDGRIYVLDKNKKLVQLTTDHASNGGITCMLGCYEKMQGHQSLGISLAGCDKILLATDGLYKLCGDEFLEHLLSSDGTANDILSKVMAEATRKANDPLVIHDDLTGILVIRKEEMPK